MELSEIKLLFDDHTTKIYIECGITILSTQDTINKRESRTIFLQRDPYEEELPQFKNRNIILEDKDSVVCLYDFDFVCKNFQELREMLIIENDMKIEDIRRLTDINMSNILGQEEDNMMIFHPLKWLQRETAPGFVEILPFPGVNHLQTQRLLESLWLKSQLNCNGIFVYCGINISFSINQDGEFGLSIRDENNEKFIQNNKKTYMNLKRRYIKEFSENSVISLPKHTPFRMN